MAISLIRNPDARNDPPRPLMEHLSAFRDMLIFMATAWVISFCVAAGFSSTIMDWLERPVRPYIEQASPMPATDVSTNDVASVMAVSDFAGKPRWRLNVEGLEVTSGVSTIVTIGTWAGTALSFPFLMLALLRFVFPALTRREKFVLVAFLIAGTVLFIGGVSLAYTQTLPMLMTTFMSVNDWVGLPVETLRIDSYLPLVLKTIVAFGLVFQIPLLLFLLGWFGILTSEDLRRLRRWAIVIIFTLAMVLTPPDPMSQIIMAVPLCLLYEATIWAVWLREHLSGRK